MKKGCIKEGQLLVIFIPANGNVIDLGGKAGYFKHNKKLYQYGENHVKVN